MTESETKKQFELVPDIAPDFDNGRRGGQREKRHGVSKDCRRTLPKLFPVQTIERAKRLRVAVGVGLPKFTRPGLKLIGGHVVTIPYGGVAILAS